MNRARAIIRGHLHNPAHLISSQDTSELDGGRVNKHTTADLAAAHRAMAVPRGDWWQGRGDAAEAGPQLRP